MPYDPDKGEEICALIVAGWTIKKICDLDDMPSVTTFFKWLRASEDFAKMYARAKEDQADMFVDEMLAIADDNEADDFLDEKTGKTKTDYGKIQRDKLRVETRKWAASKFKAKKYGDRIIHAGDEDAPLTTSEISKNEREALARFVSQQAQQLKGQQNDLDNSDIDYGDLV